MNAVFAWASPIPLLMPPHMTHGKLLPLQEIELLEKAPAVLSQLTAWAVILANPSQAVASITRAPAAMMADLRGLLQASVRSGARGALHFKPLQLLLWLLEAEQQVGPSAEHLFCSKRCSHDCLCACMKSRCSLLPLKTRALDMATSLSAVIGVICV